MFPRGYTPEAQILFLVGLAILTSGVALIVGTYLFPPFYRVILGNVVAGYIILVIGLSVAVGALVIARPSEGETARETVKVNMKGEMFPRGYRLEAIVVFFAGVGFLVSGVVTLASGLTTRFGQGSAILGVLFWGFAFIGIGGFLASWALIGGRRSQDRIT